VFSYSKGMFFLDFITALLCMPQGRDMLLCVTAPSILRFFLFRGKRAGNFLADPFL
jgi:hypothetical protein